jgi:hypothetical protein
LAIKKPKEMATLFILNIIALYDNILENPRKCVHSKISDLLLREDIDIHKSNLGGKS